LKAQPLWCRIIDVPGSILALVSDADHPPAESVEPK
jgi:hypothetical protein